MLSDRLLDELRQLSLAEKLRVMQILVNDLASMADSEETQAQSLLSSGITHEVWSPYDSLKAAQQLQDMLDEYKRDHGQS